MNYVLTPSQSRPLALALLLLALGLIYLRRGLSTMARLRH